MAIFDPKSRYVKNATVYTTTDRRGRTVSALTPASAPVQATLGVFRRKQGQRLDHVASYYLQDAYGYWRIVELNDRMLPESLSEVDAFNVPTVL